jgi:hypothetical protein
VLPKWTAAFSFESLHLGVIRKSCFVSARSVGLPNPPSSSFELIRLPFPSPPSNTPICPHLKQMAICTD